MPYESNDDLPERVKGVLPGHARTIYRKAFNAAWHEYRDASDRRGHASREETAHKVAWAAVKKTYRKGDDEHWHRNAA